MTRIAHRWIGVVACAVALLPLGCQHDQGTATVPAGTPLVRVLLLENQQKVDLIAAGSPVVHVPPQSPGQRLNFPPGTSVPVSYTPSGWRVGGAALAAGELLLEQPGDGTVSVDKSTYRGRFRLVPTSGGRFDVVNEVDVDNYLKGVLSAELFPNWHDQAYRAQAITARTYALYETRTAGVGRHFDVYNDQRSQVYGGIRAETPKSRQAADATAGVVLAYGPAGHETIFKSYFSACCGGISQSAADAFGDAPLEPLVERNKGPCCIESTKFNWGPIVLAKSELARRMRAWAVYKKQPGQNIANIVRVEIQAANQFGRPVRFAVTDSRGVRYSMTGEQFREAANTDAGPNGVKLFSSFCKPVDDGPSIRFTDGHGYGHGVGLCQWCAQHKATEGWSHEAILLDAFPHAKLLRAY